jgi:L-aspartate oxidase
MPSADAEVHSAEPPFATVRTADVLVIGSGIAGLSATLELDRVVPGRRVVVLTREKLGGHGASPLAQGGIAAALGPSDSPSIHAEDTARAADGLAREDVVDILTRDGPVQVRRLIEMGVKFDLDSAGELALGLEGAHSRRRIVHAGGDGTGAEVTRALRDAVRAGSRAQVLDHLRAVELFVLDGDVRGVVALDEEGGLHLVRAAATVLATGGPGRVYLKTTAPKGLDGDGLAMAARAGARLRDLEFVQFHPTALDVDADPLPLITEALRGSGALLVDGSGRRVLPGEGAGELTSRDRLARAIWLSVQAGTRVFLDAREATGVRVRDRFPGVFNTCRAHGIDPTKELIPVTPAAHYHMGGILVDSEGKSSLGGLWAVGEVAASGVHGANRLASNSLLEALVFGPRAARSIAEGLRPLPALGTAELREAAEHSRGIGGLTGLPAAVTLEIRKLMWDQVGVIRDEQSLRAADEALERIERRTSSEVPVSGRSLLLCARMITRAALVRKESLGSHWRSDARSSSAWSGRHSVVTLTRGPSPRVVAEFDQERERSRRPRRRSKGLGGVTAR